MKKKERDFFMQELHNLQHETEHIKQELNKINNARERILGDGLMTVLCTCNEDLCVCGVEEEIFKYNDFKKALNTFWINQGFQQSNINAGIFENPKQRAQLSRFIKEFTSRKLDLDDFNLFLEKVKNENYNNVLEYYLPSALESKAKKYFTCQTKEEADKSSQRKKQKKINKRMQEINKLRQANGYIPGDNFLKN